MTTLETIKSEGPGRPFRRKARKNRPLNRGDHLAGWLFVLPMVLGFVLLLLVPLMMALYMSFTDWPLLGEAKLIGFENYRTIAGDAEFWRVLGNTLYFAAGLVPLNIILALLLAIPLSKNIRGAGFFRTLIFIPVMTSLVVWSIVWKYMFATDSGFINQLLRMTGITGPAWLYDTRLAMPVVIVTSLLKNVGLNMVLFIAALQQVPAQLYEAARIDGAGRMRIFFRITVPMITPTIFLTVMMTIIGSLKVFGQIYVMTQGGPSGSTKVLVYNIWERAFKLFEFGYASALAYVLFVITLLLTLAQWQMRKRWVLNES
ncbi:sugar ABC transporter permease [Paenibacillus sp. BR1-192]|uniref:carbohydrate ABC transporter permease n=1 Tax=Paenibacillus sp. BR1-192 TaxID=3032287 RepID=UPI00240E7987|nr:sugar ABC transporter permease [Paenibacillus sp. BR1-192]WFB58885.1 sugar ABC transporter permease [Paenibacillus sp. BR1-192]